MVTLTVRYTPEYQSILRFLTKLANETLQDFLRFLNKFRVEFKERYTSGGYLVKSSAVS